LLGVPKSEVCGSWIGVLDVVETKIWKEITHLLEETLGELMQNLGLSVHLAGRIVVLDGVYRWFLTEHNSSTL
jgi:hypothetical protein